MQNDDGASASGGRRAFPTFGLSKEKVQILLIVIILAVLGRFFVQDDERNVETIHTLIQGHHSLPSYGITEDQIRLLYTRLAENNNFLMRTRGRMPNMDIHFDHMAPEIHTLLEPDDQDLSLEDIVDNFGRVNRFIAENEEVFIADTPRIRILDNFALLMAHYVPPRTRQPAAMQAQASLSYAAAVAAPPRSASRQPDSDPRTLQTGFGFIDSREIPVRLGGQANIEPPSTSIASEPGFASAFHRALCSNRLRAQLSDFWRRHSEETRELTVVSGAGGYGLQNRASTAIPEGCVCNLYSGFFTKCVDDEDDEDGKCLPSDRIIYSKVVFISSKPETLPEDSPKPPNTVKQFEKFSLVGWGGSMVRRLPRDLRCGAELASHSCTANSMLHNANLDENGEPFKLSGSFRFPHSVEVRGRRFRYNRLDFSFKPWFIYTKVHIKAGGLCSIDYGSKIVDYSPQHLMNQLCSRESRCNSKVIATRLKQNRENSMHLASMGIQPMPCMCEACDSLERECKRRSMLYFDNKADTIDYDAIETRIMPEQALAEQALAEQALAEQDDSDQPVHEPVRPKKRTRRCQSYEEDDEFVIPPRTRPRFQRKKKVQLQNSAACKPECPLSDMRSLDSDMRSSSNNDDHQIDNPFGGGFLLESPRAALSDFNYHSSLVLEPEMQLDSPAGAAIHFSVPACE